MKLSDILSNPVRMRVAQYLQIHVEATTKQISEACADIPAPTLYRHINFLLKEDVLVVKEERKVRGGLERLLALNEDKWSAKMNADVADIAYQFLMSLYGSFQRYSELEGRDPAADKLSLRTIILTLTDESFDSFFKEYRELIAKYNKTEDGGKPRSISMISAPVIEEDKK